MRIPTCHPARTRRLDRCRGNDGQATVEFALVIPILLFIVLGIFQLGVLFYNYIDLTSATREGARTASVSRSHADGVARVNTSIRNATTAIDDDDAVVVVDPPQPWTAGQDVTVTVTYPYDLNILGVPIWGGPMTSETVVRVE